jgi:hypothetical protein
MPYPKRERGVDIDTPTSFNVAKEQEDSMRKTVSVKMARVS